MSKELQDYTKVLDSFFINKQFEGNTLKITALLKKVRKIDKKLFVEYIKKIPYDIIGEILLVLPDKHLKDVIKNVNAKNLAKAIEKMDSDDATDLIQDIEELDESAVETILSFLNQEDKDEINKLRAYDEGTAGALMQTEYFGAKMEETIQSSVDKLKIARKQDNLENIHQIFVVGTFNRLLFSIPLEELITFDFSKTYEQIVRLNENRYKAKYVRDTDLTDKISYLLEEYGLLAIPVVDEDNVLVGRITSDDMYDFEKETSTDQIYKLAGVDDEAEEEESIFRASRNRGLWLFINLFTAVSASLIIGIFEETLQKYVALAILMPIVASMGGNAGTQALTVIVRQLAIGTISVNNSKDALIKEITLSIINGLVFACVVGIVTYYWFGEINLGFIIAISMLINMLSAGFFGAIIPILLKRFSFDPAISSTVLLTTVTDIVGFFSFLSLAQIFLVN